MKGIKYAENKSCLFKFVKRNINIIINKSFPHPTRKENFNYMWALFYHVMIFHYLCLNLSVSSSMSSRLEHVVTHR